MAQRSRRSRASVVHFRMTRAGWAFLALAIVIGIAAVRSPAPLMLIMFGAMMGALHVSAIMARRMLKSLDVRREAPRRAWQNQTVHIGYFLRNGRKRGSCLAVAVRQSAGEGIESTCGYCGNLSAGGSFRAASRFIARRRGRFSLGEVRLSTLFPFALVEAVRRFDEKTPLVVWPARGALKRRLLHHGAVQSSSSAPSGASGGQDEFFGLREYREGDNPRWIHWRRSAGRAAPVVREMARPLPEILWVILDTCEADRTEAATDRRERLIRFAATVIDHAFSRQYKVGLALAYGRGVRLLPPDAGRGQRQELLDALADIDSNTSWRLTDTVRPLRPGQLRQAQVVVVTDKADGAETDAIHRLRRSCRHLTAISSSALDGFFEDSSPAGLEADQCC